MAPLILLGTSIAGRGGDSGRRETAAQASLVECVAGGEALCVNLGFIDEPDRAGPLETLRVLGLDAPRVSAVAGPRKPVITEMLDALASEADARGLSRIGLVNGDIIVTRQAIARVSNGAIPAAALSRTDFGGGPEEPLLHGVDMVVFDVGFWRRERRRFREYLLGEPVWDNVYASIIACHGGTLINRERLILHERHAAAFHGSPYARYIHLLAARDRSYFSIWCAYVSRATGLREGGGTPEEERALQREIFRPPGMAAQAMDVGRAAWWRGRRMFDA